MQGIQLLQISTFVKFSFRKGNHTVHDLAVHQVFITKYGYHVLAGEVKYVAEIRQIRESIDIQILKGAESKDYFHLHLSYSPRLSLSELMRRLMGRKTR